MVELIIWLIAAYGMTQIIVYGSIFEKHRDLIKTLAYKYSFFKFIHGIVTCMMCGSTWVGFFMSLVLFSPISILLGIDYPIISTFFDGMLASGGVWVINAIISWFEEE